jgi:agmatinase
MPTPLLTADNGFLGLETGQDPSARSVRVLPFGMETSVSYGGGTARGPEAILEASHQVETFDDLLWCEPHRYLAIETVRPGPVPGDTLQALDRIEALVAEALADGRFPLVLGGEHSVTIGAIRPLVARHPDLTLLQIDAHADLRDGYEGNPNSHASAMRRCLDHPGVRVEGFGIRNISAGEIPLLEAEGDRVRMHFAADRDHWDLDALCARLAGRPVWITVDVDGLDSTLMPATGTPEPGGLTWNDAMTLLRRVARVANVVGADVVELAPIDTFHAPDFLAAKLCYRILSFALVDTEAHEARAMAARRRG